MPLAFITGASSGIGQALALRYYQSGHALALVARRTAEVETWRVANGLDAQRVCVYEADVAVPDSIIAAGQASMARQGLADVVIANAGISIGMDTAVREDIAVMARIFAVNNIGMAATFQPFVQAMRERRSGTLVGIASVAAIRGLPGHGGYCASKAGWSLTAKACAVNCARTASRWSPWCLATSTRRSRARTVTPCRS